MKIQDFSPYFNEKFISEIKISENKRWMSNQFISESDKSFSFINKAYDFPFSNDPFVKYIKINGDDEFTAPRITISKKFPFIKHEADKWGNERVQRNILLKNFIPNPEDIIILSDIDEIIDSRFSKELIQTVHKHGIITVRIRFTMFFLNLFVNNWPGPSGYSYRVFLMTGDFYNNSLKYTSDKLRKLGESGELTKNIHCFEEFAGFHHSWLGDAEFIAKKIISYSHSQSDHHKNLFLKNGDVNTDFIKFCLVNKKNILGDQYNLIIDNSIEPLTSVKELGFFENPQFYL